MAVLQIYSEAENAAHAPKTPKPQTYEKTSFLDTKYKYIGEIIKNYIFNDDNLSKVYPNFKFNIVHIYVLEIF